VEPYRREAGDIPAARGMAIVAALLFAALIAALVLTPSIRAAASWAGAGLVGASAALLGVWLLVLRSLANSRPTGRRNDDYLLAGVAALFAMLGFATFAAGVLG
jgi:hypothetical protein